MNQPPLPAQQSETTSRNKFLSWIGTKTGLAIWTIITLLIIPTYLEIHKSIISTEASLVTNQFMSMVSAADDYFQAREQLEAINYAKLDTSRAMNDEIVKAKDHVGYEYDKTAQQAQDILEKIDNSNRNEADEIQARLNQNWKEMVKKAKEFAYLSGLLAEYDKIAVKREEAINALEKISNETVGNIMASAQLNNTSNAINLYQKLKIADDRDRMSREDALNLVSKLAAHTCKLLEFNIETTRKRTMIDRQYYYEIQKLFLAKVNEIQRTGPITHFLNLFR